MTVKMSGVKGAVCVYLVLILVFDSFSRENFIIQVKLHSGNILSRKISLFSQMVLFK